MAAAELAAVADEVLQFLVPTARVDVKVTALQYFLGLTGTPEGRIFMRSSEKILIALFDLTSDPLPVITKDALLAFLNLSAEEECSWKILNIEERNILPAWLKYVADKDSSHVDLVCMILSNVTRSERCCVKALEAIKKSVVTIDMLVDIFCHVGYNASGNMHYLGPVFSNLTQLVEVRQYILKSDKERCIIQRLLAFTSFMESNVRRGGVIGAIRNCCFESDYHDWLLGKEVDILPQLLLPLAGPEEFDDEDMDSLPVELQYLPEDKQREPDDDVRKMILEALTQLCATKPGREYMKSKNTYVVLRALDGWEKSPSVRHVLENLIQIFIGDDPEPDMENLHKVEIPDDVKEKLKTWDEEDNKRIAEEETEYNSVNQQL